VIHASDYAFHQRHAGFFCCPWTLRRESSQDPEW
jgi:hypothetical protein